MQLILDLFFPGFEKYDPARQAQITETVVLFVRKGAHFAEYALLGLALSAAFLLATCVFKSLKALKNAKQ